jgi:uncharacterized protein YndB with AHSA1/START domain
MKEEKFNLEYPLQTKSPNIIWELISTASGLQKWIADEVIQDGDTLTFTWGQPWTDRDTKSSRILEKEKNRFIKMRWDYHEDEESYWELRIQASEITGNLVLLITDYAEPDDIGDLKELWASDLERLHQVSGL